MFDILASGNLKSWAVLAIGVWILYAWVKGSPKLTNPDDRVLRLRVFDKYYNNAVYGKILFILRNIGILIVFYFISLILTKY